MFPAHGVYIIPQAVFTYFHHVQKDTWRCLTRCSEQRPITIYFQRHVLHREGAGPGPGPYALVIPINSLLIQCEFLINPLLIPYEFLSIPC